MALNMDKEPAVNTTSPAAAETTVPPVLTEEDAESKIARLEAEKARLIEESANYKLGMLKAKKKAQEDPAEEDEEEKMARVATKVLQDSRLAEIAREQDAIIQKALKENKELKLAQLNKTTSTPSGAMGTHSESIAVTDTTVTPEQLAAFKARGWSEKDIERYKRNLQKNSR